MKKILLSLFVLLFSVPSLFSQVLIIYHDGQPIESGSTVYINAELQQDQFFELISHAKIKNNTDREMNVMLERITMDTIATTENYFCFGQCFAPWVSISSEPVVIPAGGSTADDTFSGHYLPKGKAGSCILEYVFYNESNPSEKASMIVHFTASPTAVPDISSRVKLSNAYPNPANSKVSFDFDLPIDIKNASLKLYNLLGQPVAEQTINQTKGKIEMSVSDLNEGVYFYSLHINNETIITKKLIVRH